MVALTTFVVKGDPKLFLLISWVTDTGIHQLTETLPLH